jgi:hypothetical protein
MISDIDKVDTGDTPGVSSAILDTKHGSAAGSVPRTSLLPPVAGLSTTPRNVSPLGEGNNGDDTAPPEGKRRAVSRGPPAPPPGVILQKVSDADAAAAERSLDLSSDDSMPGAQLEVRRATLPRLGSRSRALAGSPRVRAHLPRSASDGRVKRMMPMTRGPSPMAIRKTLANHEMVKACRAGGDQDVEARLRVLEQQREDDHAYFVELREHCLKMGSELDKKVQKEAEAAQYLRELTARGLQFQQGLVIQKAHS